MSEIEPTERFFCTFDSKKIRSSASVFREKRNDVKFTFNLHDDLCGSFVLTVTTSKHYLEKGRLKISVPEFVPVFSKYFDYVFKNETFELSLGTISENMLETLPSAFNVTFEFYENETQNGITKIISLCPPEKVDFKFNTQTYTIEPRYRDDKLKFSITAEKRVKNTKLELLVELGGEKEIKRNKSVEFNKLQKKDDYFEIRNFSYTITIGNDIDVSKVTCKLTAWHYDIMTKSSDSSEDNILGVDDYQPPKSSYKSHSNYYSERFSKEETGYVGLQNQGATCYMNSALQSLFHLPAFRRLTFQMPTENVDDEKKSIPLNLQRLFCRMQTGSTSCTTTALTQSFGWGATETFMQHDIQEFVRVLIDNLETKLKGTPLEPRIADLFKGQYRNYVRCKNVDFESTRTEDFYDLQMQVKGNKTLENSFRKYIEAEELTGDNQYSTDDYGKQDAVMGVEFIRFPTVLQIHLARFEYDFNVDRMVKNNERLEFPEEIDLAPYLAKEADHSKSQLYELFGVLVHSGTASYGHYYAFLRPSEDPQWYKFNDSRVSKATKEAAVDDNFGGSSSSRSGYQRSDNGYMLVYVRKDAVKDVFEPVKESEIPQHVREYCSKHADEVSYGYSATSADITLITEDDARQNVLRGKKTLAKPKREVLQLERSGTTGEDLYKKAAEALGTDAESIRLWISNFSSNLVSVAPRDSKGALSTYSQTFYVEPRNGGSLSVLPNTHQFLVKFFFPGEAHPMQFLGVVSVPAPAELECVKQKVRSIVGLPEDAPLIAYYEDESFYYKLEETEDVSRCDNGSVLILQQDPHFDPHPYSYKLQSPKKEEKSDNNDEKSATYNDDELPTLIYDDTNESGNLKQMTAKYYITHAINVTPLRIFSFKEPKKPIAIIKIPENESLSALYSMIAKATGIADISNTAFILYKSNYYDESSPGDKSLSPTYQNVGGAFYSSTRQTLNVWFSVVEGYNQEQLKDEELYSITYTNDCFKMGTEETFLINRSVRSVSNLLQALKETGKINTDGVDVFKITYDTISLQQPNETVNSYYSYLIQPHTEDMDKKWTVSIANNEGTYIKCASICFFADIIPGETAEAALERLCAAVGLKPESTVLYFKAASSYWPEKVGKKAPCECAKPGDTIYLVEKKAAKKKSHRSQEAAVKIYN